MATILIGEVDADVRDVFTMLFRRAGYDVLSASDRTVIIDTVVRDRPDLVVLNLRGDDGPDACRALRADARTSDTPILMLSADLYPDAADAAAAGADAYLAKPLDNKDLLRHAQTLLTRARTGTKTTGS